MPKKYRVDGVEYIVPDDATLEQVAEHVQSKSAWAPGDVGKEFDQPTPPPSDAPYRLPGEPVVDYMKRRLTFKNLVQENPILGLEMGGAKKIPQLALGLGQAVTNLGLPLLDRITGNVAEDQAFRNAALNRARAFFDPTTTAEKVGGFGPTTALAASPALLGGGGVLALAGQGALSGGITQAAESGKIGEGTGYAAGMGAVGNVVIPPVLGAAARGINQLPGIIRKGLTLKAMSKPVLDRAARMGKDVWAAIAKEKLPVPKSAAKGFPVYEARLDQIGKALDDTVQSLPQQPLIDPTPAYEVGSHQYTRSLWEDVVDGLRDDAMKALSEGAQPKAVALNTLADKVAYIPAAKSAQMLGVVYGGPVPAVTSLTPMEALWLKRGIASRLTFGPNPALGKGVTDHARTINAGKRMVTLLDKELDTLAGPEFSALNERYSNFYPAVRAMEDRMFLDMNQQPWLFREFPKKLLIGGAGLGASGAGYWFYRRRGSRP